MGSNGELAQIGEPEIIPDYCDAGGISIGGGDCDPGELQSQVLSNCRPRVGFQAM